MNEASSISWSDDVSGGPFLKRTLLHGTVLNAQSQLHLRHVVDPREISSILLSDFEKTIRIRKVEKLGDIRTSQVSNCLSTEEEVGSCLR